jgi:serine/threonine-protein kinase
LAVDGRADQFSLAVIVFEMLTGEKPFTGEQLTTVVNKIVAEEPALPHRLNSTLSQQISNVLRKALAKRPDARYPNCQKFVDALEAACHATKGWQPLARGGSLTLPTAVEARRPARVGNLAAAGTTEETKTREGHKVGVLPVLLAVLVAAGLVGLIAWQAAPWITDSGPKPVATEPKPPAPQSTQAPAVGTPPEVAPSASPPPPEIEEKRPSPMPPAPTAAPETTEAGGDAGTSPQQATTPERSPIPEAPPHKRPTPDLGASPYLKVSVSTVPADATAMLDNHPDTACTTPCALDATPGQHIVSITRSGYQTEHRSVTVADASVELPPVALRVPGGVLMLSSEPTHAKIYVDGNPTNQVTAAKLELPPGKHEVAVEKDGKRASREVEIQNGITQFEKIILDR